MPRERSQLRSDLRKGPDVMSSHATNTAPLPAIMIKPLVRVALLEDLGRAGDITTNAIVPADARATAARRPAPVWILPSSPSD